MRAYLIVTAAATALLASQAPALPLNLAGAAYAAQPYAPNRVHPTGSTGSISSATLGYSHYSDGHTVVYSGERIPAFPGSSLSGSNYSPHSSGHGGHSSANSRHDHHPY